MSAKYNDPVARVLEKKTSKEERPAPEVEAVKTEETTKPTVIMSELDSYVHERMKAQPRNIKAVVERVDSISPNKDAHRLSLPEYFESFSFDNQKHQGPYVFRWIMKDKRALDRAMDVLGWTLVNRVYFPDAPTRLFTANGGVERGDAILAFIPAKAALKIRELPGKASRDALERRMTSVDKDYVLMTGNPKDDRVYRPELGPEGQETEAQTEGSPVQLVEGRDF